MDDVVESFYSNGNTSNFYIHSYIKVWVPNHNLYNVNHQTHVEFLNLLITSIKEYVFTLLQQHILYCVPISNNCYVKTIS